MKRIIIGLISILLLLLIAIPVLGFFEKDAPIHTLEEIEQQFEEGNDFLLVMGTSTCHACKLYRENTLPDYVEIQDEYPLYFIYTDKGFESRDELNQFLQKHNINYNASPTSYIVKDGIVSARVEGYIPLSELERFIENEG